MSFSPETSAVFDSQPQRAFGPEGAGVFEYLPLRAFGPETSAQFTQTPTRGFSQETAAQLQQISTGILGGASDDPVTPIPHALGGGADEPVGSIPGLLLGGAGDEGLVYIPQALGGSGDVIVNYVSGLNFSPATGANVSPLTPAQTYGMLTGANALFQPLRHHSHPTGEVTNLEPPRNYNGHTGGTVFFIGVPPPINLVAIPVNVSIISLTWTDVSDHESGFRIERSLNGQGIWTVIGTMPANTTGFVDYNATPLVVFDYQVIGFNLVDESIPSNIASAYTQAPEPAPPGSAPPPMPRILEFLSPGVYGLERGLDGNIGGSKI